MSFVTENGELNQNERNANAILVKSYPEEVWLSTDTVCNVQCLFCTYNINAYEKHTRLSDADIVQMDWLRYPRFIALFASGGDPLANKRFAQIVEEIRRLNPTAHLYISTNGKGLTGKNIPVIAEHVDLCHVSMNAIQEETYNKIIQRGNFKAMVDGVRALAALERRGKIELSMILMRSTVGDLKPMIEFSAETGCSKLVVSHYIVANRADRLPIEESVFGSQEVDDHIEEMNAYAERLGVEVSLPVRSTPSKKLVTDKSSSAGSLPSGGASAGNATASPELVHWDCYAPWTTAHLVPDLKGFWQLQLCCNGTTGIRFAQEHLYDFHKVWNSDRLAEIRATVNSKPLQQNKLCFNCRNQNLYDPGNANRRQVLHSLRPDAVDSAGMAIPLSPYKITHEILSFEGLRDRLRSYLSKNSTRK